MKPLLSAEPRGPLKMWRHPREELAYVVGADVASGTADEDYSAAVVVELGTGAQCATWHGKIDPGDFGDILMALGVLYGGKEGQAHVCPEAQNHGLVTLDRMRQKGYWNLYTRQEWDSTEKKWIARVGWQTSMKTRPMLIGRGRQALKERDAIIYDEVLLDEAARFVMVFDKDGRFVREDHVVGAHDDVLFAWMLAQEGRFYRLEKGIVAPAEAPKTDDRRAWVWDKLREMSEQSLAAAREVAYEEDYW